MPNRLIREGFLDSASVEKLSFGAECCYHRMLISADDAGRLDARLDVLKSRLYPIKAKITLQILEKQVDECVQAELAIRYLCGGDPYLQLTKWQSTGQSKISRFPWSDGRFEIEVTPIGTRAGVKNFISTSILNRINGSKMASVPHPDAIPMASVPHPDAIPMPSTPPQVDKKSQKPMASVPHPDAIPMPSGTHQSKISSDPSETETETETGTSMACVYPPTPKGGIGASESKTPDPVEKFIAEGRDCAEWPSKAEYLQAAAMRDVPGFYATIDWELQEEQKWERVGNWRMRAAGRLPQWWRRDGCPKTRDEFEARKKNHPGAAYQAPAAKPISPVAQKIALEQIISTHPANPESTAAAANPTTEQRADFREKQKIVAGLVAQIAQGRKA